MLKKHKTGVRCSRRVNGWSRVGLQAAGACCLAAAAPAGVIVDLTTANSSGTINGAVYQQAGVQPTGTGVIDSFVQVSPHANGTTAHAYNTTENNTLDNKSSDNFNRSIQLSDVPVVGLNGGLYRQFLLDINESNSAAGDQYLSLDEVQLFVGGTANSDVETFTSGVLDHDGTLVYRMDAGMDNWVALNYDLGSGSGSGDMYLYVANALFAAHAASDVVTLYSAFGEQGVDPDVNLPSGNYGATAGFEEWAAPVPEPTTGLLAGVALGVLATRRRRAAR